MMCKPTCKPMHMERLTKHDENGCLDYPWEFNGVNGSYDILDEELLTQQIDRLAAYEDTGLTPEEIKYLFEDAISEFCISTGATPDHLLELFQAEKDGRLRITPVTVWHKGDNGLHEVPYKAWMAQWIGIKFWMTRKEAEAALEGGGG